MHLQWVYILYIYKKVTLSIKNYLAEDINARLTREAEGNTSNMATITRLESHVQELSYQLKSTSEELHETSKQRGKEQTRNRSVDKHAQVRSKVEIFMWIYWRKKGGDFSNIWIFPDFRINPVTKSHFASECSWKKRTIHQGKKEVACIVSKPLVSCLWECGESVNPPKLNIQEVQGGFVL